MTVVNLTPHPVVVQLESGEVITFQASGQVARVNLTQVPSGDVNGIPVVKTTYGTVDGLPDPQPGTVFIVSGMVMSALRGTRQDVIQPDTGPDGVIRDVTGRIVAVKRFQQ